MRYVLDVNKCEFLGKGKEGSVYLTPEGYALKIFYNKNKAERETDILEIVNESRFFPKVLFIANNMVVRDYVEGDNLYEYINKNGLSYSLSTEIIELIEEFKKLNFTRLDIRNAHVFVNKNEKIQVIDPRKVFEKNTPYPKEIIKVLVKLNIFDEFLKHVLTYSPKLIKYWINGYNYFKYMSKKTIHINMYAS
ncbi:serine/threonine protein kinase [Clostridium sp.]|uniref:serine/threonine protein kinase n=1 Tax=Clostridium sp. TaxID=1506 RepID=UPI0028515407|nr:serine/threonine protein kinase [Clostridium sp.]MDR3595404.1 serine/threonine protein kinase [Clostridium sp.]